MGHTHQERHVVIWGVRGHTGDNAGTLVGQDCQQRQHVAAWRMESQGGKELRAKLVGKRGWAAGAAQ
eukprot:scaffold170649_cov19-Tisochrysis_lutea.AAC.1